VKSPRHIVPMLIALTLTFVLSGCSTHTAPTALDTNPVAIAPPTLDQAPPALPSQIVSERDGVTGGVALEWTPSSSANVATYEIYLYSPDPTRESAYVLIGEAAAGTTRYNLPLTAIGTSFYRLRTATTAGMQSEWSPALMVTTGLSVGSEPEPGDGIILKGRP